LTEFLRNRNKESHKELQGHNHSPQVSLSLINLSQEGFIDKTTFHFLFYQIVMLKI
jgi:hypothetical protein